MKQILHVSNGIRVMFDEEWSSEWSSDIGGYIVERWSDRYEDWVYAGGHRNFGEAMASARDHQGSEG